MTRTYEQARDELTAAGHDPAAVDAVLGFAAAVFPGDTLDDDQFETVEVSLDTKGAGA